MAHSKPDPPDSPKLNEKSESILNGAMQEFLTYGYAGARMDRIAATAGVSKATIYSYFQDKERLFGALVQQMAQQKLGAVFNLGTSYYIAQGEPDVVLRSIITQVLDKAGCDPQWIAFMRLIIGESGRFPELARAYVDNIAKPGITFLTEYLASCPTLKLSDPEATARVLIGSLVYFIILQRMLYGKEILPMEDDRLIDNLIQLITRSA